MRLTDDELRAVIARAQEIDDSIRLGDAWNAERAAVIGAGEELGLSRRAIERALTEQLDHPPGPPTVGSMVWARSVDGKYAVAEVLAVSETGARVRFLRGGEHPLDLDELRPCGFLPGERVACNWPMWGPWTCSVVSYDAAKQRVKLSDGWGYTKSFRAAEVWLAARTDPKRARGRVYGTLLGIGVAAGAVAGSIITLLLSR
jgi:hypothetical protein